MWKTYKTHAHLFQHLFGHVRGPVIQERCNLVNQHCVAPEFEDLLRGAKRGFARLANLDAVAIIVLDTSLCGRLRLLMMVMVVTMPKPVVHHHLALEGVRTTTMLVW